MLAGSTGKHTASACRLGAARRSARQRHDGRLDQADLLANSATSRSSGPLPLKRSSAR